MKNGGSTAASRRRQYPGSLCRFAARGPGGDMMRARRPLPAPRSPGRPMFYSILKFAHILAIILWVGGMIFAYCFLRPAAAALEPPQRLQPMRDVLGRFLTAVLWSVAVALASRSEEH